VRKLLVLLALTAALCLSCESPTIQYNDFSGPELTIYEIASYETGCPEWILRGLRFAESSYGANVSHPDPLDVGDYGLHETPDYHAERASKWGEYNPYCPLQSAIIAGHIIMDHFCAMGDMDQAISAYRRGRTGTRVHGTDWEYVEKVRRGGGLPAA